MAPAQPQQVVAQRRRQEAHVAIGVDAQRPVTLAELGAVGPVDQRNVGIDRLRPAHRADDLELAEGVVEMIVAADDMGHAHVVIVDDDGQHVGRRAVGAQQDHVVELGVLDRDLALHRVLDDRLPGLRRLEAHDRLHVGGGLLRVAVAPAAVVAHRLAGGLLRSPHLIEFLRRGIAVIGMALGQHLVRDLGMAGGARELIGDLAVPRQAEPGEPIQDRRDRRLGRARAVGVLDAQQVLAAVMLGEEPVEQGRSGAADMQVAGGRGGEAGNDGHWPGNCAR